MELPCFSFPTVLGTVHFLTKDAIEDLGEEVLCEVDLSDIMSFKARCVSMEWHESFRQPSNARYMLTIDGSRMGPVRLQGEKEHALLLVCTQHGYAPITRVEYWSLLQGGPFSVGQSFFHSVSDSDSKRQTRLARERNASWFSFFQEARQQAEREGSEGGEVPVVLKPVVFEEDAFLSEGEGGSVSDLARWQSFTHKEEEEEEEEGKEKKRQRLSSSGDVTAAQEERGGGNPIRMVVSRVSPFSLSEVLEQWRLGLTVQPAGSFLSVLLSLHLIMHWECDSMDLEGPVIGKRVVRCSYTPFSDKLDRLRSREEGEDDKDGGDEEETFPLPLEAFPTSHLFEKASIETSPKAIYAFSFGSEEERTRACACVGCSHYTAAYLHHMLLAEELLGEKLIYLHNMQEMLDFVRWVREGWRREGPSFLDSLEVVMC